MFLVRKKKSFGEEENSVVSLFTIAFSILEYMAVGLFQESFVVDCGVQQVVQNISKPLKNIHLGTQISEIKPTHNSHHRFELIDEKGTSYLVDHIIFATQGNQAISMLKSYYYSVKKQESDDVFTTWKSKQAVLDKLEEQIDMLKKFKYDRALVINHTDSRLLPSNKNNWKALNLAMVDRNVDPGDCDMIVPFPYDTTMTTHILNMTHDGMDMDQGKLYMQTTNPCIAIDPKELLSVAWFERATVTLESKKALEECLFVPRTKPEQCQDQTEEPKLGPCQGENGIWFVGSYCWKGIPLLEGCVASAEHVVIRGIAQKEGIAMEKPW
jgi:hypothetical protein